MRAHAGEQRADRVAVPDDHPVWKTVAAYLGEALAAYVLVLSPERTVLGGGVIGDRSYLFDGIRQQLQRALNGYVPHAALRTEVDAYVVPAALHSRPGVLGALTLARQSVQE